MSQITLYADLLFDDASAAAALEELVQGKASGGASEFGKGAEQLAALIAQEGCYLDEIERIDQFVRFSLEGGTLSFPYKELIATLKKLPAHTVVIEVLDDQVGEELRKAFHHGKRFAFGKARQIIDSANPVLGVCNAIEDDSEQRVLKLLKEGLDPDSRLRGRSLLSRVCEAEFSRAAVQLIQAGADCSAADPLGGSSGDHAAGRTPLHWACGQDGGAKIVKALIAGGADVSACDTRQRQPLHEAAEIGLTVAIGLLLDAGANIEATDVEGATPLIYALRGMLVDAAKLLIDRGANVQARCAAGGNARWYAGANPECVELLQPYKLVTVRPANAYDGNLLESIRRALRMNDRDALPALVDAADNDVLKSILKDIERGYCPFDTVDFMVSLASPNTVGLFAASLYGLICKVDAETGYQRVVSIIGELRRHRPDEMAVIDAQCGEAMAFLEGFLEFVEESGLKAIVSPLSPESQALIDRLMSYFTPDASYHKLAKKQMQFENTGSRLTMSLNQIRPGDCFKNLPIWRSDGVVGLGRKSMGTYFGVGVSCNMTLTESGWKFS